MSNSSRPRSSASTSGGGGRRATSADAATDTGNLDSDATPASGAAGRDVASSSSASRWDGDNTAWARVENPPVPDNTRRALLDALKAKHLAIKEFSAALGTLELASASSVGGDKGGGGGGVGTGVGGSKARSGEAAGLSEAVLGAMLFFINFELIDIGKNTGTSGWRRHLESAGKLMALLVPATNDSAASRALRDFVLSDCLMWVVTPLQNCDASNRPNN